MTELRIADGQQVHIRWMIRSDLPEVLAIETARFGEYGWGEEDFFRVLRHTSRIGMVAEVPLKGRDFAIGGYVLFELRKSRLEILNLAVYQQRRGIGRQMIDKLVGKLSSHRRTKLGVVVRESNLDAQLFFRAMGFQAVRVLRGHCDGEDGYRMVFRLRA